ncbi:hypothetical protein HW130_11880 [Streptomyces sp. PKU-EA00015]|uniref:hypothetical protein n=1 Tax=Streptomyces sp. PKU-EA00015 TaxID=2748326 RepID=UPI0015A256BD|nr:hypothetical protein [Streptomyces sp. PKU-EA00015]NWF26961.1 hypothetical protein [Streptomyces sp. PKU-EA00015]
METAITVSVIIAMIVIGVLLIHLLNGRHAERIAAFHYGDAVPGIGRRGRRSRRPAERAGSPVVPAHPVAAAHRKDREGTANDA